MQPVHCVAIPIVVGSLAWAATLEEESFGQVIEATEGYGKYATSGFCLSAPGRRVATFSFEISLRGPAFSMPL